MRYLTRDDGLAAVWGGLVLGAGGGGLDAGLKMVDAVFELGRPKIATLDEFPDDALAVATTGVGAPGTKKRKVVYPSDSLKSIHLLSERLRQSASDSPRTIVGSIIGHPGAGMARSWLASALDEKHFVLDCATNGRGHPSVRMGGLGITDDVTRRIILTAVGGVDDVHGRIELVMESPLALGSDIIRRASALLGGNISAARGPFSVGFLREAAAPGAISTSIGLGRAMLDAEGSSPEMRIEAVVTSLGGQVSAEGRVRSNSIELDGAYEVGEIAINSPSGAITVGVVNEYLTMEIENKRVATFPDLIALFSAKDGQPVSATLAAEGDDVVVVTVPRASIPIGKGAYDPAAYTNIEKLLRQDFLSYL